MSSLDVNHVEAGGPGGNLLEPVRLELGVDGGIHGTALLDHQAVDPGSQVHRVVNQFRGGNDFYIVFLGKLLDGGLFIVPDTGH